MSFVTISGAIIDPAGNALPGVLITITTLRVSSSSFPGINAIQVSREGGEYSFSLSPGMYRVDLMYPGKKVTYRQGAMLLEEGSPGGSLNDYVRFSDPSLATPTVYSEIKYWYEITRDISSGVSGQVSVAVEASEEAKRQVRVAAESAAESSAGALASAQSSSEAAQRAEDAKSARDEARQEKEEAGAFAEIAQSGIAVTGKDVYPDDATGLAAVDEGGYFQVPQGVGAEKAFITKRKINGLAVSVADFPGMGSVRNLLPLNATTEYGYSDSYDDVTVDRDGNILQYLENGKRHHLVPTNFSSLNADEFTISGKTIDPDGTLPGADKNNLLTLSESSEFSSADDYAMNPKVWVVLDSERNILFDVEEYIDKSKKWDEAYDKSEILEPQKVNPLATFSQRDANGFSQIRVYNTETSKEAIVTSGASNETSPRPDVLDRIVWTSDRVDTAPGGLFYAALPDLKPHAYIARPKLVGWGHSFMENARFMNKLAELTGLYGYNFGKSSMRSPGIAARQGGLPSMYMPVGGVIPESGTVNLTPNVAGPAANFANAALNVPPVIFGGVPGTFTWNGTQASFTRADAGEPVAVPEPALLFVRPFTTASVTNGSPAGVEFTEHDECINIFWLGRNNGSNLARAVTDAIAMIKYLKNIGKRVVLLPDFPGSGENTGSANNVGIRALNAAYKAAFPEFYCEINGVDLLQNFINHHNPNFAGDVEDVANGVTPRSLRYDWLHPAQGLSGSGASLSPDNALYVGAEVNAQFVYEFMKLRGWV
nr:hypothetical protein [Pantoea sp. 201603H]